MEIGPMIATVVLGALFGGVLTTMYLTKALVRASSKAPETDTRSYTERSQRERANDLENGSAQLRLDLDCARAAAEALYAEILMFNSVENTKPLEGEVFSFSEKELEEAVRHALFLGDHLNDYEYMSADTEIEPDTFQAMRKLVLSQLCNLKPDGVLLTLKKEEKGQPVNHQASVEVGSETQAVAEPSKEQA